MTSKSVEVDEVRLREALLRRVTRRMGASGKLAFPAVPSLVDHYAQILAGSITATGRPFSAKDLENARALLAEKIGWAFASSPNSWVVIEWTTEGMPGLSVTYSVTGWHKSIEERYAELAIEREPPLFGKHPDARLMDLARSLGPAAEVTCLDVAAGTGRNAIPLALAGHPVDAIELAPALADELEAATAASGAQVNVVRGDFFDRAVRLPRDRYRVVVLSEMCSHWRGLDDLRRVFVRLAELLEPAGVGLLNVFVTAPGYEPDAVAREYSQIAWAPTTTRADLETALSGLPLELISDDPAKDYEQQRLPAADWPPTSWYERWSSGGDVFDLPAEQSPLILRWLAYRRT